MGSSRVALLGLFSVALIGCAGTSAVRGFFEAGGYSYPVQMEAPSLERGRLVCPGCDEPEKNVPEGDSVLGYARRFVSAGFSRDVLRSLSDPDAEAFLIEDAYLFQDPPGGEISLAIQLAVFKNASNQVRELTSPHKLHPAPGGDVLELWNIMLWRLKDGRWEYAGWVY